MKLLYKFSLIISLLFLISACDSVDRFSILKKCTVLGDESIIYARAHYVKIFYHFNPNKFEKSYKKIEDFDAITHKNTIDTYTRAIDKISTNKQAIKDKATQKLLSSCKNLAEFSTRFVDNIYPNAIKFDSNKDPLSDEFFIEINQLVKFDHNIGTFDQGDTSFKQYIDKFKSEIESYISKHRTEIPSEFANQRLKN